MFTFLHSKYILTLLIILAITGIGYAGMMSWQGLSGNKESHIATALPVVSPQDQNPKILFENGLLTVQATEIPLKSILEEIEKKANVKISVDLSVQDKPTTLDFEQVTLKAGLEALLRNAGITNHAAIYRKSNVPGNPDTWVLEKIYLKEEGASEIVATDRTLQFSDPKGNVLKTINLLPKIPGKSWSRVTVSKNHQYTAVNHIYAYDQKAEIVRDAEMIIFNNKGVELWRVSHFLSHITPSTNGGYVIGIPDPADGGASVYVFNKDGILKEIEKDDGVWSVDFSYDGSFYALTIITNTFGAKGIEGYDAHLVVIDSDGNELWRKTFAEHTRIMSFYKVKISDDNNITLTTGSPDPKVFRFDKKGNPIE